MKFPWKLKCFSWKQKKSLPCTMIFLLSQLLKTPFTFSSYQCWMDCSAQVYKGLVKMGSKSASKVVIWLLNNLVLKSKCSRLHVLHSKSYLVECFYHVTLQGMPVSKPPKHWKHYLSVQGTTRLNSLKSLSSKFLFTTMVSIRMLIFSCHYGFL